MWASYWRKRKSYGDNVYVHLIEQLKVTSKSFGKYRLKYMLQIVAELQLYI